MTMGDRRGLKGKEQQLRGPQEERDPEWTSEDQ